VASARVVSLTQTATGGLYNSPPTLQIGPPDMAGGVGAPSGMGVAYMYVNQGYDTENFPQPPEIRVTINGKNDLFDPRTGLSGFSFNWALQVNDILSNTNPMFGIGDQVNEAQLIAAANVCDELVSTSQGETTNYAQSINFDTSTSPCEALSLMMPSAAGRLSYIGGEWFIWPAYWQGPSFTWDEGDLAGEIEWTPNRSFKDLINCVNGTYIAPNYPYSTAGNLYDRNGWYYGQIADVWPFQFQPTNFPQYAVDVLHGYGSPVYLDEDGGIVLPRELTLRGVNDIVQAQRVAKVVLLRNRFQGSGSFPFKLYGMQMQNLDVMQFNFAALGWTGKVLEIDKLSFTRAPSKDAEGGDGAPVIIVQISAIETDSSIYEWSTAEELTPYDVPALPGTAGSLPSPSVQASQLMGQIGAGTQLTGIDCGSV
jgi:hypothetical protein